MGGGGPTDWMAQGSGLPSGNGYPTSASGSFPVVSGVTSEYDGAQQYNDYSVQLNSNYFSTPACNNISGCLGWEQFVYSTGLQQLLIQFWLINYGSSCPSGWQTDFFGDCFKNSPVASVPGLVATGLGSLSMSAQSSGLSTTGVLLPTRVWLYIGSNAYYTYDDQTDTLSLTQGWSQAEFNIFGDGSGAPQAIFNPGSSITVKTSIADLTPIAYGRLPSTSDSCVKDSTTGESNNLNLGACTATPAQFVSTPHGRVPQGPYISFTENN